MKLFRQGLIGALALSLAATALSQTTPTDTQLPWVGARPLPTDILSVTHDSLPDTGLTFYSVQRWNQIPPVPTDWTRKLPDSATASLTYYISPSFGTNRIIVDDRLVNYDQAYAELQNQRAVLNAAARLLNLPDEMIPEDESGGQTMYSLQIPTDGSLWLEITNVTGGIAFLNLDNATNSVYAIWTSTDLLSGWQVDCEVWPTNQQVMPFTLPPLDRQSLFIRAEDWTGVDTDSDGIPDWWIWLYFGNLNQSATNLDTLGNTLLYDYTYGLDPNVISFCLAPFADHVTNTASAFSLSVRAGAPASMAILVDTNNPGPATWYQFQTNLTVDLGANASEGWHQFWFGLRGRLPNSIQTWQSVRIKLDRTSPLLVITNSIPATTDQNYIQVQGYANEQLSQLICTVANTNGITTNQTAPIVARYYSTATAEFTTNWFQCFDVLLATGTNTITVRAADLAGNASSTNLLVTLDPSSNTNAPSLVISWPADGATLGSSDLNCFGTLDNPAATVYAVLTDSSGQSTPAIAEVERDGHFWIDHLPLSAGTSTLTLTATSPAGINTIATLSLVRSAATITVDAPVGDWLNTPPVTQLTGTVPSAGYTVTVNGLETYLLDDYWLAQNLPLDPSSSTAVFRVRAVPQSGPAVEYAYVAVKPPRFYISEFWYSNRVDTVDTAAPNDGLEYPLTSTEAMRWADHQPGTSQSRQTWYDAPWSGSDASWPAAWWPAMAGGTNIYWLNGGSFSFTNDMNPSVTNEQWNAEYVLTSPDGTITSHYSSQAGARCNYYTGGVRAIPGLNVLAIFTASALDYGSDGLSQPLDVPPEQIQVSRFGSLSTNGTSPVLLAAGSTVDATAAVASTRTATRSQPAPVQFKPTITWADGSPLPTTSVSVSDQLRLAAALVGPPGSTPPIITNWAWTVPGYAVSNFVVSADSSTGMVAQTFSVASSNVTFVWVDGGKKEVTCRVRAAGKEFAASTTFSVMRPSVDFLGVTNTGILLDTNVHPGIVLMSFGGLATNASGSLIYGIDITSTNVNLFGWHGSSYGFLMVQTISQHTLNLTNRDGSYTNLAYTGLDNSYPTQDMGDGDGAVFSDSPATGVNATNSAAFSTARSYRSVLMYQTFMSPTPVPLREVLWSWSGHAATNGNGQWVLLQSNTFARITANNRNTTDFPYWTNVVRNIGE